MIEFLPDGDAEEKFHVHLMLTTEETAHVGKMESMLKAQYRILHPSGMVNGAHAFQRL